MSAQVLIKFLGDKSQLSRTISGVQTEAKGLGAGFQRAGASMASMAVPALAAGAALFKMAQNAGANADALFDMQDQTGVTVEKLQEMQYVADQAGVSQDFYAEAVNEVVKAHDRIIGGTGPAAEALEALGIAAQNTDGSMRSAEEITDATITALLGIEDASTRAALAEDIFKRKAQDLLPVLGLGAEGISAMRAEAHSLGTVQSGEALTSANEYRQGMEKLQAAIQTLVDSMMENLLPTITDHVIPALEWVLDIIGKSVEGWTNLDDAVHNFLFGAKDFEDYGDVAGKSFEKIESRSLELRGRLGELRTEQQNLRGSAWEAKDALDAQAAAAGGAAAAIQGLADTQRAATDPAFALRQANQEYTEAQGKVAAMEAAGTTNTQEYRDAIADLLEEQADLNYATEEYEAVGGDAAATLYDLGEQARIATEHVDDFLYALENLGRVQIDPIYIGVDIDDIWRQLQIHDASARRPI